MSAARVESKKYLRRNVPSLLGSPYYKLTREPSENSLLTCSKYIGAECVALPPSAFANCMVAAHGLIGDHLLPDWYWDDIGILRREQVDKLEYSLPLGAEKVRRLDGGKFR